MREIDRLQEPRRGTGDSLGSQTWTVNGRRPLTLTSFKDFFEVGNIDQRVMMPSRHTAAITAPFRHSSVTGGSVGAPA
jgi:hypothetical protein